MNANYYQILINKTVFSILTCLLMGGISVFLVVTFFRNIGKSRRIIERIVLFMLLAVAIFIAFNMVGYSNGIYKLIIDLEDPQFIKNQGYLGRYHHNCFAYILINDKEYIVPKELNASLLSKGTCCEFVYAKESKLLVDLRENE